MIRLSDKKLIIEIPCNSESPLEKLAYMQEGLIGLIGLIDYHEAPKEEINNGLTHLRILLQEMMISPEQFSMISDCASTNIALQKTFR